MCVGIYYIGGTQRHYKGRFVGFRHVRRQIDARRRLDVFPRVTRDVKNNVPIYIVVFIDYRLRARVISAIYIHNHIMYLRRLRLHTSIRRQKHRERSYSNVVIRLYYVQHTFSIRRP